MPIQLNPYVTLDGNCEAAVKFWASVLNGEVTLMRMGDSPMPVPPEAKQRIMHAVIKRGDMVLMASDSMPGQPVTKGGQVSLSLNFDNPQEQQTIWDALIPGGTVEMPLGDQFFGRFGMLTDKFGLRWMLHYASPKG
jgi:PhnB protein